MNEKNIFFYMNNNSFLCRKQLQKYIKKNSAVHGVNGAKN